MKLLSQLIGFFRSGVSFKQYYKNMNSALRKLNDEYTMLHFPLYVSDEDSFLQSQKNLTDYCIERIGSLADKTILEIGCGNGVQAKYLQEKFKPRYVTGIDLDEGNISIANSEKERRNLKNINFYVDDAQNITAIKDNSIDVVVNIESAFHYPDKSAFLDEIFRVLRPGGLFLIADILTTKNKGVGLRRTWKKRMILHHWNKKLYEEAIPGARLQLSHSEDITKKVINGFRPYRQWIRQRKKENVIGDLMLKLYYRINVYWTIFLLRYRRRYYVYVGSKPVRPH